MGIVQQLSVLALRPLIGPAPEAMAGEAVRRGAQGGDSLAEQFDQRGTRLSSALQRASESAWEAVELALVGESLWERTRASLRRHADQTFRQQVRAFLDVVALDPPTGASEAAPLDANFRQECLRDLRAARRSGALSGGPLDLKQLGRQLHSVLTITEPERLQTAERELWEEMADELQRTGHRAIGRLLALDPQRKPILVTAAEFFLRLQVEADPGLLPESVVIQPNRLPPAQAAGYQALAETLTQLRPQLKTLLDELMGISPASRRDGLDLQSELQRLGPALQSLGRDVFQLLEKLQLERREVLPRDSLAVRGETERQQVLEAAARFRSLPDDQRRQLPGLLNAIGKLLVVAGEFESAQRAFEEVVTRVRDPRAQAEAWHNSYRAALERRDWDEALTALLHAAQLDPERFAPLPLHAFEAERILGAGGFGVTFVCRHRSSGTRLLVKALQPDHLERAVADLFSEAQVLQEIDQPALLPVLESDYADAAHGLPYLVMDYFNGQTLADYVQEHGPLRPADLLAVARPVVEALQAVHARNILHRGIKPANLLVRRVPGSADPEAGPAWQVKLIDFSLSLKPDVIHAASLNLAASARCTLGASVAGTLDYAAPEKLGRLEGASPGPHSDVYSFGKTCYFALLGTPEPDDEEKEDLPPAWRRLLSSCTARALAKRLPDFAAVLERLQAMTSEPLSAPVSGNPAPAPAGGEAPDPAVPLTPFQRGLACHNKGEYDEAITAFSQVLELEPNNSQAYAHRGDSYRLKGDQDRAIGDFTQALRIDPNNPLAYINQGIAYRLKGDFDQAIANYNEALRLAPDNALALNNRGNAHADRGDYEQAIADYTEALRLDSHYAWAYHNRGNAYAEQGEYDQAIADFTRALRLEPNYAVAYVNRGDAYRLKGDYDQAIADFTEALRLDPNNTLAYVNRGDAFRLKGEPDRAIADFTEALGLDPTNSLIYRNRGIAYRLKGEHDRAITDFTQALRLDPDFALAYNNRGNVYSARGDYDQAIADFTEAIKLEPKLALAYMNRGLAHAKKGAFDAVVADCSAALKLDPKLAAAYFIRGAAFATQGDQDKAIADFTRALRLDSRHAVAYNDRGLAFANKGDYDKAVADYTEALKIDPRYALAYANRGITLRLKGDADRAIADFTRALRIDPKMALAYYHRGQAYVAKEDFDRAIADYTLAHRLDPHNPDIFARRDEALKAKNEYLKKRQERRQREAQAKAEEERRQREAAAYFIRAKTHADKGAHDDAIIDYTEAVRLDPNDAMAHFHRGLAYLARQDHELAITDFTEAIRLNPRNAEFFFQRGVAHRIRSHYDRAIADFAQTLKLDPHHPEAAGRHDEAVRAKAERPKAESKRAAGQSGTNLGQEKKDLDRNIGHYTEIIKQDANNLVAYQGRAQAYEQKGEIDKAIADQTEVLRLAPRDPAGHRARGTLYHRQGDFNRAILDFTNALRIEPESAVSYCHRGLAFLGKDEYPRAIADFTRALKLDPKFTAAFAYRGQAYRLNGQYEKAIADCDAALQIDPQFAAAFRNRGLAYAALGEHARAKHDYDESIRLDPALAST